MDVEYTPVHGYISNIPSHRKCHRTLVESRQEFLTIRKECMYPCKSQQGIGKKGKGESEQDWPGTWEVEELKQGSDPDVGASAAADL